MTGQHSDKNQYMPGETEAWYKDFFDHARDLIQCVDSEGRFIFVNQAWLSTLKYSDDDINNITLWDIIHPDSMEHCMAVFKHVLTGKAFGEVDAIFTTKDGTPVMVEGNVSVKLDENGRFVYTRGIFCDVTERKAAEEQVRKSEEKYRSLFNQSLEGIYLHDLEGRILDVNDRACAQSGYSREEWLGLTVFDGHPSKSTTTLPKAEILQSWNQWKPGQRYTFEGEHQRKDGSVYPVEISTGVVHHGDKNVVLAVVRDITEQKKTQENIKSSEERFNQLADQSHTITWEVNANGLYTYVSHVATAVIGYRPEELVGKRHFYELHPE